jgi:competence protein ComEC
VSARVELSAIPGGWLLPVSLVTGALAAHLFTDVPPAWLIVCAATVALPGACFRKSRWIALFVLACCWSLFHFHLGLQDRLAPSFTGVKTSIDGTVSSIPVAGDDYLRFQLELHTNSRLAGYPARILVHWYRDWPELKAGQQWRLLLKLKPPWGRVNFQGADKERWLFSQGIGGLGTAYSGEQLAGAPILGLDINVFRTSVINTIAGQLEGSRKRGIVQALATADRSAIAPEDRRLLTATGTAHLLAISGLHVGLAAAGGMGLGRLLLWLTPQGVLYGLSFPIIMIFGLTTALLYSALAGYGLPTVRSVIMLCTTLAALLLSRSIHPFWVWLTCLALMTLANPFAPMEAGFWFSFTAVAALLAIFLPRMGVMTRIQAAFRAQWAVILVLLPLSALFFSSFTPSAFAANLIAIPWVSLTIVPPVLVGVVLSAVSDLAAGSLWGVAGEASELLFLYLEWLDALQGELEPLVPPSRLQAMLATLGAFLLLLPRGVTWRWAGVMLVLPLFLPAGIRATADELDVEVLDAGQGTAVILSSGGRTMLYDSGPGDGQGSDLVTSVILPALAVRGFNTLDQVIISHGDLDHAGGLASLLDRFGHVQYLGNLGAYHPGVSSCVEPRAWAWPGVSFRVIHPAPGLPYLGNDSSCVISVETAAQSILLSGDISRHVENRLLLTGLEQHGIVLVPHHGSSSSSSSNFLDRLSPDLAIATASLGNRFGFPRPEVQLRYQEAGAQLLSTGDCGAIRLSLHSDGRVSVESARRERNRVWRWPAAGNCP